CFAQPLRHRLQIGSNARSFLFVVAADDYFRARANKLLRTAFADSTATACDDDHFVYVPRVCHENLQTNYAYSTTNRAGIKTKSLEAKFFSSCAWIEDAHRAPIILNAVELFLYEVF